MNHNKQVKKSHFSFFWLGLLVMGHVLFLYLVSRVGQLPAVFEDELATGFWAILGVFTFCHLGNGFFEYFFHRYVLHAVMFPWLAPFARKHRHHHGLTPVLMKNPGKQPGAHPLLVDYAIERKKQEESSAFPPYALIAFIGLFSVPIVLLKLLLPGWPILIGGFGAVIFSYTLYEGWHAVEHFPYATFWKPKLEHRRFGRFLAKIYGYHQMHHANYLCNEAISGFFGLPLDIFFGTLKLPKKPFENGELAIGEDFELPKPCVLIQCLDKLADRREKQHQRHVARRATMVKLIQHWIIKNQHLELPEMLKRVRSELAIKLGKWRLRRHCYQLKRKGLIWLNQST